MREVKTIIDTWCDLCAAIDKRNIAVDSFLMAMSADGRLQMLPRLVDACTEHGAELNKLMALLHTLPKQNAHADPAPAKPSKPRKTTAGGPRIDCPAPGCGRSISRSAFVNHMGVVHGVPRIPQPKQCPGCTQTYSTALGMSTHRLRMHGYNIVEEFIEKAKQLGSE